MLYLLVYGAALITFVGIAFTVGYIVVKGLPNLNMSLFAWTYNSENVSLLPALINTVFMTILALSVAVPIGIGASIYLVEYARRDNPFVSVIRIATETLSGIPSIIYGLFGALFFVKFAHMGLSFAVRSCYTSYHDFATDYANNRRALLSVPDSYREGAFAAWGG